MTDPVSQKPLAAPIPMNEAERLAALHRYKILDTPPEAAFDRITRLAARLFEMPIALISLVDESRAWFKSCIGFSASEVPRDATLCSFAVLTDEPLIIPDTRLDDRFACNPFVQAEPGVRFYAGAPLLSHNGFNLGTLCLLDSQPREALTSEQQATLVDLAAMVVDELELRLAAQQIAQSEEKYRRLFESIDEGFCICEMLFDKNGKPDDYRFLEVNPVFAQLTGLEAAVGKTARELVPNLEDHWVETYGKVIQTGEPVRFEQQSVAMNCWFAVSAFCIAKSQSHQFGILFTNITDRKQAEQQRERFFAVSSDLQVITGNNGYFQWVSPSFERILGWTQNEMTAYPWTEFVHPDDINASVSEAASLFFGNETFQFENRYRHKDGSYRWFLWNAQPCQEEQVLYGAAIDITDRKQAEAALRQSESRFRLMVESAKEYAIFTLDLNGTIASWNSGAQRLLGYTETEAIGCHGRLIFTPEDNEQAQAEQEMETALTQGQAEDKRWHIRKDGSRFWANGLMMPLQDEAGTVQGLVKIMQDTTAQQQASERIHLLYETTSDLLATEQPLTLMHNLFGKLSAQLELHCYYNFMVEEKNNQLMLHLKNYEGIAEEIAKQIEWIEFGEYLCGQVAQARQQIVLDCKQIAAHPHAELIESLGITAYACQPLLAHGRLLGSLSFGSCTRTHFTPEEIDLLQSTCDQIAIAIDRANLSAAIQQQAEQLQQANRIKDEFLAVLSHELRSPLNPILGWTRLLQNGKLDATRQREALTTIERNAKLQTQLIEDLLDISRIMQGKLSLTVAPVSLTFVITAAVETVRLAAEAKKIQIVLDLPTAIAPVSGDAARLQQVIWNLLTNAVKFTLKGGQVTVELRQIDQLAQIRVIDPGKGISPDFLPYVFEYFRQADATTTRKFGGLGLGLAIVRQIVEMHGGTVWAESEGENRGATFTVQLPLNLQTRSSEPELSRNSSTTEAPLSNLQILLVDDETDTREFQSFLLEQSGARVTAVASGFEALQALDQFTPDVIVSDVGMAEMDGYMLMQQIRSRPPEAGGRIPAIALTAYAGEINQQQAIAAGFQMHLTKPVEPETLISAIINLLKKNRTSQEPDLLLS